MPPYNNIVVTTINCSQTYYFLQSCIEVYIPPINISLLFSLTLRHFNWPLVRFLCCGGGSTFFLARSAAALHWFSSMWKRRSWTVLAAARAIVAVLTAGTVAAELSASVRRNLQGGLQRGALLIFNLRWYGNGVGVGEHHALQDLVRSYIGCDGVAL